MKACEHLLESKEKLMVRWEKVSLAKLPDAQELSRTTIRDHIPHVFSALCDVLKTGVLKIPEELSKTHGRQRSWSTDYSLSEVMSEYSFLKNVIYDELMSVELATLENLRLIGKFFDEATAIATVEFVGLREHELNSITDSLVAMNLELETFAAVAAHDLRSPTATIIGFADLIVDEQDQEQDHSAEVAVMAVNTIKKTAHRMLELIDQLLGYAKIGKEHLARTTFSLKIIASEAKENLTAQIQDSKAIVNIKDLPDYSGDAVLFCQLFQNLISNSLKFKAKDRTSEIVIAGTQEKGRIRLHVKDNGLGFDPKLSEIIFQPFERGDQRTGVQGSGLGLATAKKIVELHGGTIRAIGKVDEGAEVIIDLPTVH